MNFDWEKLKKDLEQYKPINFFYVMVTMPQTPPIKPMTGIAQGIEPLRGDEDYWQNKMFLQKQKESQEFKERLERSVPNKKTEKINKLKI